MNVEEEKKNTKHLAHYPLVYVFFLNVNVYVNVAWAAGYARI